MFITLTAPLLGMIEGVPMPRDTSTVIDLPDHAAKDLIKRNLAVLAARPATFDADVEVRVEDAPEKRGPGRPASK